MLEDPKVPVHGVDRGNTEAFDCKIDHGISWRVAWPLFRPMWSLISFLVVQMTRCNGTELSQDNGCARLAAL